ncbi:MAG: helicase-associated domain-containing protein [Chloroflexota bacterium]
MNIEEVLQSYNFQVLKAMAEVNAIDVGSTRKAPHVRLLAKKLYNRQAVERTLPQLSARERRALDLTLLFGGATSSQRLKQALLRESMIQESPQSKDRHDSWRGVEGDPKRHDSPYFEDIVMRLTCLGLILSQGNADPYATTVGFAPGVRLVIPPQVLRHLPPVTFQEDTSVPAIDIEAEASARTFQRDLFLYWSFLRDNETQLTQHGYVFKRQLKQLSETLLVSGDMGKGMGEKENPRLHFIRLLLQEMGLVKVHPGRSEVQAVQTTEFWGDPPPTRLQKTFETWREGTFWNELDHLPNLIIQTGSAPDLSPVVTARKKVLQHLQQMPAGEWVALRRLVDRMRVLDYEFLFSREVPQQRRYYGYGYYSPAYDTPYSAYRNPLGWGFSPIQDEAQGWEMVEAQFIRHVVAGPLYWMGLVDLGYAGLSQQPSGKRQAEPERVRVQKAAFRLTEIGAWLLGLGPAPDIPTDQGRVVVQPNFQIFALDPISDHVLATLDQFAERISAERAIEYRLTRQSVYVGQQKGWTARRIAEYLEETSGAPLPQNVARTLEEWEALHRRIVIHRRTALAQTVSPSVMDSLLADAGLSAYLSRRLTPTVALLKPNKKAVDQLERQLQRHDLPPARTIHPGKARRPCLTLTNDGRVVFAHKVPSIFLFGVLGHFISQEPDGEWWLSPKSVQQALSRGLTVPDILKELTDLHRGPLPGWAVRAMKAWGKFLGDARLETLTLIQFRDAAALRELTSDPELAPYLQVFLAEHGLARIRPDDVPQVRRLLAERGVEIVGTLTSH